MNTFGTLLRSYRQRCKDPDHPDRALSQERFGELLGREVGGGYSGAAISDWERGVSKIHADHRLVLLNMIKILHQCGGLDSPAKSSMLLKAGNYRDLDPDERAKVFLGLHEGSPGVVDGQRDGAMEKQEDMEGWPPGIPSEPYYPLPQREETLQFLLSLLEKENGPHIVSIEGMGGQGKTALAAELARRALQNGVVQGIVGETAKQEVFSDDEIIHLQSSTLDYDGVLDGLARQLRRWEMFAMSTAEKEVLLSQVFSQSRYLIILDNLEEAVNNQAIVVRISSILGSSYAVLTSREKIRIQSSYSQSLNGLSLEDTTYFLRAESQRIGTRVFLQEEPAFSTEIHRLTGGSPLAIKLIIAQSQYLDLHRVMERLRHAKGNLFPFIFRSIWEHLEPDAKNLLLYIGKTVMESVGMDELSEAGIAEDDEKLVNAIDQLVAWSLLNFSFLQGEIRYSVHPLTRQFLVSDLPNLWREQGLL